MKKESSYMLVVGIVVGILAMLFISFQLQLSNVQRRTAQLEQAVGSNTQAVQQIVNFINQSTGATQNGENAQQTPATE
ncbi:MAG: hypothetical protein K9M44_03910 [Candidatus Pacebacteria bacterium]|nr:hypothetical protein [Candidatus Paceibacterota bacterium]